MANNDQSHRLRQFQQLPVHVRRAITVGKYLNKLRVQQRTIQNWPNQTAVTRKVAAEMGLGIAHIELAVTLLDDLPNDYTGRPLKRNAGVSGKA